MFERYLRSSHCPRGDDGRRPDLSPQRVKHISTGDAKRETGLLVLVAKVASVRTAERFDTPGHVGKATLHVERPHISVVRCCSRTSHQRYVPAIDSKDAPYNRTRTLRTYVFTQQQRWSCSSFETDRHVHSKLCFELYSSTHFSELSPKCAALRVRMRIAAPDDPDFGNSEESRWRPSQQ